MRSLSPPNLTSMLCDFSSSFQQSQTVPNVAFLPVMRLTVPMGRMGLPLRFMVISLCGGV